MAENESREPRPESHLRLLRAMHDRLIAPERASTFSKVVLGLGSVFSVWYLTFIAWSPGLDYSGTFGPFTNPSAVLGLCLGASTALAFLNRARTARLVALFGAVLAVVVGALSAVLDWLGPSLPAVAIFAGFGILGAIRLRGWRDIVRATCAWILLVICSVAIDDALLPNLPASSGPIVLAWVVALLSLGIATVLMWPIVLSSFARSTKRLQGVS